MARGAYVRRALPLSSRQRHLLTALRSLTLLVLVGLLLRPVKLVMPASPPDAIVAILVDTSRSMALADAGGQRRIDRAGALATQLAGDLGREFQVEVLTFGEKLAPHGGSEFVADGRRSDLVGALRDTRKRYEGKSVAGMVIVSDGGDTSTGELATAVDRTAPPVFAIGIGSPSIARDREVLSLTAGDATLPGSVIDLNVSAVSHGFPGAPIEMRVLANGRSIEVRRVTPPRDGSPVHEVFRVSPDRSSATLYTVEIPASPDELAPENNRRTVLVSPPGRKRRLLLVEGAPGFEHSFLKRAWAEDEGFEIDSVVKKGKNDQGVSTFLVQGDASRSASLVTGYPTTREALFAYDTVVFGNVEAELLTRDQLVMTAAFVAERGGGLLALGARTFQNRGLLGTPIEEVLPLHLNERAPGILRTSAQDVGDSNKVFLTDEGATHPMMRIALDPGENRRRWAALPALASSTALGGPRPGAQVLAVASVPGVPSRPIVAIQRYGRGRSMIFAGEAAWRWRMMLPASDRSYETFWRQVARWMSTSAPDPVSLAVPAAATPGEAVTLDLVVRDRAFSTVPDANTMLRIVAPDASTRETRPVLADAASGRYTAVVTPDRPGVYRVNAEARAGTRILGAPVAWLLVGGADRELTDPRLNEEVLRRTAEATGGRYLAGDETAELGALLRSRRGAVTPERREIWHSPWTIGLVLMLLSAEWALRRRWGMR